MNAARRKALGAAIDLIEKFKSDFADAMIIINTEADAEREYYDSMPESIQSGDKGTAADEAATALEEVKEVFNDVDLDDLISKIDDARGTV